MNWLLLILGLVAWTALCCWANVMAEHNVSDIHQTLSGEEAADSIVGWEG